MERSRSLQISFWLSVLIHVLFLRAMVGADARSVRQIGVTIPAWKSVVFVDTSSLLNTKPENPTKDTRLVSQESFSESDMSESSDGDTPAVPEGRTDLPPEIPESAVEPPSEDKLGEGSSSEDSSIKLVRPGRSDEGVPHQGAFMYNIKMHEYADYYKHIRDSVIMSWQAEHSHDLKGLLRRSTRATVLFRVHKDGRITNVRQDPRRSEDLDLVTGLMQAVSNVSPLEKFPDKITEPYLNVRFNFYFM